MRCRWLATVFAITLLSVLAPATVVRAQSGTPAPGTGADSETLARRFFEDLLNQADSAAVDELLGPSFVFNVSATFASPPATVPGGDAFRDYVGGVHASFPDVHYTVNDVEVGSNEVVARWVVSGTHLGDFQGIPATGAPFTDVQGISVFRIEEGRIAEGWTVVDMSGLLSQLGVLPTASGVSPLAQASATEEQWFVLTFPGQPTRVVASGALQASGIVIDLLRLNRDGSFDNLATQIFSNGTLYYHGAGDFRLNLDPATCIGEGKVVGPFQITGGTGAYEAASGEGVALITLKIEFGRSDTGCSQIPTRAFGIARAGGSLDVS